ncbi:MAG: hypothetical protein JXR63_09815 [Spirochaetales bacterium]|nr:hypothetical protein [Spirochaetales bacterium]
MRKKIISIVLVAFMFIGCASGSSNSTNKSAAKLVNNQYSNSEIGISLNFPAEWSVWKDRSKMPDSFVEGYDALVAGGLEVLFLGHYKGIYGCRGTAEKAGMTAKSYSVVLLEKLAVDYKIMATEDVKDGEEIVSVVSVLQDPSTNLLYMDVFLAKGDYNVRLTFWSDPENFEGLNEVINPVLDSIDF